jgi:hypothetical protein
MENDKKTILVETCPILIYTQEDLKKIGKHKNFPLNANYILMEDIDMLGVSFEPIGTHMEQFVGTFFGNGKKIMNLTVNNPQGDSTGFFGYTCMAILKDIFIENVNILGKDGVGGLVGSTGAGTKINNCHVTGQVAGNNEVGGLVGNTDYKTRISNCKARVTVIGGDHIEVGKLIGFAYRSVIINSCAKRGVVVGKKNGGAGIGFRV